MVLEELLHAKTAERKPFIVLPVAFIYATFAMFIALWIFPSAAGIVAVFLVTLATMPLFFEVVLFEKQKEESTKGYLRLLLPQIKFGKRNLSPEHNRDKLLAFFIYLFLGMALATTVWFVALPSTMINDLFQIQLNTIREINLALSGNAVSTGFFSAILLNNIKVLVFSILFSFIYGAGAIFILAWNASVIGVAMGDTIRSSLNSLSGAGASNFVAYTTAVSAGLLRFLIHGIPEVLAYFIGALAGGMLSIAIMRQEFVSEKFGKTVKDAAGLFMIAVGILIIAAVIEVVVSPNLGFG